MAPTSEAVRERVAWWGTTGQPPAGMIDAMTRVTHIDETVTIGGDLSVGRIGYGAMQLTGPKVWGEYPDHDKGVELLPEVVAVQWKPCSDRQNGAVAAPAGDRRRCAVAGEDVHYREVGIEERPDRLSDCREDLAGGRLLRDEHRHAPQRRLLLGERTELLTAHRSSRLSPTVART